MTVPSTNGWAHNSGYYVLLSTDVPTFNEAFLLPIANEETPFNAMGIIIRDSQFDFAMSFCPTNRSIPKEAANFRKELLDVFFLKMLSIESK
jgi:hypothetical protein